MSEPQPEAENPFAKLRSALQGNVVNHELASLMEACVVAAWTPGKLLDPTMIQMLHTAATYRLTAAVFEVVDALEALQQAEP